MNKLTKEAITEIVSSKYSLKVDHIDPLPSGINFVYLLKTNSGRFILKDYVKLKSPQLDEIHSKLIELMQGGLSVPKIIQNLEGKYLTKVDGKNIDLTEFVEHIDLSDQVQITDKHLILAAETLAEVHDKLGLSEVSDILTEMDFDKKIDTTLEAIDIFKNNFDFIRSKADSKEQQKLDVLRELIYKTDFYRAKGKEEFTKFLNEPFVPTHGDYSMVNVLITDKDEIYIIDWDSLSLRPVVWDLQVAISLFSLKETGNAYMLELDYHKAELFLKSYIKKSKLTKDQLLLLPEVAKYNFAIYWLSYTLPAVNSYDFRLLFLIPDKVEKGLYWIDHFDEYTKFIKENIQYLN